MLSSIHPLGERAKGNRFGVTAGAYITGSLVGGLALGLAAYAVGWPLRRLDVPEAGLLAVTCLGCLAVEAASAHTPSWRRQVDETWLTTYRGWVYGAGFGVQLGAGVVTIITSSITYAAVVGAAVQASPIAAGAVGLTFGATRGVGLLGVRRVFRPQDLAAFHRRFQSRTGVARATTVATLAVCSLALVVAAA